MILLTIFVFAIILGLLIFVHELGHFIMAKRAGMKVEEFGFGFPPRIFGIKRGETIYSINWIPLGGFVKILGEDSGSEGAGDPRSFASQGFWPRLIVLVAGIAMNFLLAWFLFWLGFAFVGMPTQLDQGFEESGVRKIVDEQISVIAVQPNTPASIAGFRPGDQILSIDGLKFENIDDLIAYATQNAGIEVVYELKRGQSVFSKKIIPRQDPPEGEGAVGFAPAKVGLVKFGFFSSIKVSAQVFIYRTWAILSAFFFLIKGIFESGQVSEGFSGPVGIAVLTRDFVQLGFAYVIQFAAILSINLAIINGVPFPALDGGRVVFLIIEKIRGVKSQKWEQIANMIGFALLIVLMIVVTFRDFGRYSEQFKNLFDRFL